MLWNNYFVLSFYVKWFTKSIVSVVYGIFLFSSVFKSVCGSCVLVCVSLLILFS